MKNPSEELKVCIEELSRKTAEGEKLSKRDIHILLLAKLMEEEANEKQR